MKPVWNIAVVSLSLLLAVFASVWLQADEQQPAEQPKARDAKQQPERKVYRGKVVLLTDALKRRDIAHRPEMRGQVVLETDDKQLVPLLADWRGRAFFQDERLRNRKVELVGYQQPGVPYVQVLMVFTFDDKNQRQFTDYWCDICSIPMYEIKPCDCCQGDIRLRFQHQDLPDYLHADQKQPPEIRTKEPRTK